MSDGSASDSVLRGLHGELDDLEALYKDVHSHPELSLQETRTAGLAAERLKDAGFAVTDGVGGTGVVGLLKNGDGPTVMLRADMDALPVKEATGLPYASTVTGTDSNGNDTPVMHACGHDMHVAWLAGASALLAGAKDAWRGTLMAVFQPAEEVAAGAQAMIDDGLFERFPKPDVILGQHVMPMSAGTIASKSGVVTSAGDSFEIRMFGRGAHGSMPQASAESQASGAPKPPEITQLDRYDLVRNDDQATERVRAALRAHFGDQRVAHSGPASASEDFGSFGAEWHAPSVFWFIGGVDPDTYAKAERDGRLSELPTNHNPKFAPIIHPTLETGIETLVAATCAWLAP